VNEIEEIKNKISTEQIFEFLYSLGAEPVQHNGIITCRTICHGGDSHKLYYYENTKLFRCYTQCNDGYFDIFQLVIKINSDIPNYNLPQAVNYIKQYFGIYIENEKFSQNGNELSDWAVLNRYLNSNQQEVTKRKVEMKFYDGNFLKFLPRPRILPWEKEGIKPEVIKHHNICYNPASQGIVIPHYDINDKLVGIRERTLIKENEIYGKYRPMYLNKKMYNHPLGFNLYNINNSKNHIKEFKKVIIFEGEKSPLLYASYFGQENDITVACCGNNLSSYQFELLMSLGIEEMIIAFDKQYKKLGDEEFIGWTKKLTDINKKYGKYVRITYMFDKEGLLDYKDAPIDKGKNIFLNLYRKRFSI